MPVLDIGRNTAYELVRSGQIRNIRVGRQIRVPKDAVREYLFGATVCVKFFLASKQIN